MSDEKTTEGQQTGHQITPVVSQCDLEAGYDKQRGSGSGHETAYTVEARCNGKKARVIAGQIFDNRWQKVEFEKSPIGVPAASPFQEHTLRHRLLGYSAAQALRWWIHAQADSELGGIAWGLETRLVKHKISYSYSIEAVSAHCGVDAGNSMAPDWNLKTSG